MKKENGDSLKKAFQVIIRIGISFALIFFLLSRIDRKAILEVIKSANPWLLLLAFLVFVFTYLICLLRWEMLLKAVHSHLRLKRILLSFSGGLFFNVFLPSTIGGDLVRSFDLASHTKKPKEIIATVLLDRLSGYAGLVIIACIALVFGYRFIRDRTVLLTVGIITAVLVFVLSLIFNNFLFNKVNKIFHSSTGNRLMIAIKDTHQEMYYFRHHENILVFNILYSVLIQICVPISFYLIALALGVKENILYFFLFVPLITAITLLPVSIGGLGLRDATTVYFFAKIGMAKDAAFAMSLVFFSFTLLIGALGGLLYVLTLRARRLQHHQEK